MIEKPSLLSLINQAKKGDTTAMIQIVHRFTPLIRKYSSQLGYDEAYSDLIIWIVTAVHQYRSKELENG